MENDTGSIVMSKLPSSKNSKSSKKKQTEPKTLAVDQKITVDDLREQFPNLYSELTGKKMSLGIDQVEEDLITSTLLEDDKQDLDPFNDYEPKIFDFLARAKEDEEGLEIIDFLEKQNQISSNTAEELREIIKNDGIRALGPLRFSNYYFRKAAEIRSRRAIRKRYLSDENEKG
jgi:hypothetical protein